MGIAYNTSIVTSGLVMAIDAANVKSYPGSGSTWFDLSGSGNHMTLFGSPTIVNNAMTFNGSTQYATNSLDLSGIFLPSTIIAGSRYTGSANGRVVTSVTNNWILGHWAGTVANYYAGGTWITPATPTGGTDTNWRIYAGTSYGIVEPACGFYINGDFNAGISSGFGPNGISLGRYGGGGGTEYSACQVSFVLAYNRVLTAEEIRKNYNAFRSRLAV